MVDSDAHNCVAMENDAGKWTRVDKNKIPGFVSIIDGSPC